MTYGIHAILDDVVFGFYDPSGPVIFLQRLTTALQESVEEGECTYKSFEPRHKKTGFFQM